MAIYPRFSDGSPEARIVIVPPLLGCGLAGVGVVAGAGFAVVVGTGAAVVVVAGAGFAVVVGAGGVVAGAGVLAQARANIAATTHNASPRQINFLDIPFFNTIISLT